MKIAICDDDRRERERLRKLCETYFAERGSCTVAEYASGEELFLAGQEADGAADRTAEQVDVLLLDIEMSGLDGIQVKKRLEKQGLDTRILFVTSHDEYMPEAFGRNVMGFLGKPVDEKQFQRRMDEILADLGEDQRFIKVHVNDQCRKIFLRDILYMEAQHKDVDIYTETGRIAATDRKGISQWAAELAKEGFVLVHKSYLVNLAHVKKIDREILLDNGSCVKLSRDRKGEIQQRYWDYIEEHAR